MSRDYERQRQFTRRAILFGMGQAALTATLLGRLYYLQVVEADKYSLLSEENRISLRLIIPPRGLIKDRNGVILAENARNFRLSLIPEKATSAKETLFNLAKILNLSEGELNRIASEMTKRQAFKPIIIHENLNWDQVATLELNSLDLPGALIDVGQTRNYPFVDQTSHALGYVGPVSEFELDNNVFGDDAMLRAPEVRVGKKGIEKNFESQLRGQAGSSQLEVNAYGRIIRELETDDGQQGQSFNLSMDIEVQKLAMERMQGQSGSAIVMNAHTGELIALASAPGFNPNLFNQGISTKDWEQLLNDPLVPLTNKAIAGLYAPGSTFKIITALSGLENDVIDTDFRMYCDGHTELGSAKFHCWKKEGHGTLDLTGAIRESCDVYFYEVANRLGVDRLAETARKFGLAKTTGIDIPGEKSGLVPDRRWKMMRFKKGWHKGETLIAGIGQGYLLATPLQLAVMTAHFVNGGKDIAPHLVRKNNLPASQSTNTDNPPSNRINGHYLDFIRDAMIEVTNAPNGTARGARIKEAGFEMGGKTGTAQVRRITMAERAGGVIKNENLPYKQRDHALFVGFAPIDAPRYVVSVVIEHGGGGSAVAAPIARDLLLLAQKRDPELAMRAKKPEKEKPKGAA